MRFQILGRSVEEKTRLTKGTISMRIEGQNAPYHCHRAWKQQEIVAKSIQTQYGGNNCGLWIVGFCYAQSNYVFKAAVVHTGWHVTFQAKIRLMTRKSIAKGKAMLI